MRLHHRFVDFSGEKLSAHFSLVGRVVDPQEAALAGDRLDHALALEFRVSLRDGVAVDAQLLGERTDRWKGFPRLDGAGGCGSSDLIDDLQVNGLAGFEVELEAHRRLSYDSMTVGAEMSIRGASPEPRAPN